MRYSQEFKDNVVARLLSKELSISEAVERYSIGKSTISYWLKIAREQAVCGTLPNKGNPKLMTSLKPVFVKILQKNWLGVFLSLKNLSRGFAPTLRYPRIFFNMNRRLLVLCFLYYARAVQGGIPMTANVNRNGSVRLRGAISLSG